MYLVNVAKAYVSSLLLCSVLLNSFSNILMSSSNKRSVLLRALSKDSCLSHLRLLHRSLSARWTVVDLFLAVKILLLKPDLIRKAFLIPWFVLSDRVLSGDLLLRLLLLLTVIPFLVST